MAPHLHRGTRAAAQWHSHNQSSHLLLSPLATSISTLMHIHHHNSNTFTFNRNNFICSMSPVLHNPHHNLNTFTFKQNVFVSNPFFFWDVWTLSCLISPLFHPLSWSVLIIEMTKLAILYESGPCLVAVLVKLCRHRRYTRPSAVSNQP